MPDSTTKTLVVRKYMPKLMPRKKKVRYIFIHLVV